MKKSALLCTLILSLLPGCASLRIENVDYGWPVESVATVTSTNSIEDERYVISFSVAKIAFEEFQDSTALRGLKLRLIRGTQGYYFLTGPTFKNVYVFMSGEGELNLKNKIEVSKTGLVDPALNQRPPYVELLDGDTFRKLLSSDDIVEGKKK